MSDAVRRFELAAWEQAPVHYAAGFGQAAAAFVPALLAAFRTGTARMAALIGAQSGGQMQLVVRDMQDAAAEFRDGAGLSVPIAAVVARGVVAL